MCSKNNINQSAVPQNPLVNLVCQYVHRRLNYFSALGEAGLMQVERLRFRPP